MKLKDKDTALPMVVGVLAGICITIIAGRLIYDIQAVCQTIGY